MLFIFVCRGVGGLTTRQERSESRDRGRPDAAIKGQPLGAGGQRSGGGEAQGERPGPGVLPQKLGKGFSVVDLEEPMSECRKGGQALTAQRKDTGPGQEPGDVRAEPGLGGRGELLVLTPVLPALKLLH